MGLNHEDHINEELFLPDLLTTEYQLVRVRKSHESKLHTRFNSPLKQVSH